MKQKEIFDLATKMGMKADFRGEGAVKKHLARQQKKFEALPPKKQADFDQDRLINPYLDSGVWADNGQLVKKVLVGIDICAGEVMLAKELGADTIINHHPLGKGLTMLDEAMHMQSDILALSGVPINIAESLMSVRISEVGRGVHASNSYKVIDAARLVGVNLMNVHMAADNLVAEFLKRTIDKNKPEYVNELMELIAGIEEYKESARRGSPVKLFAGSEENHTGKIVLTEITGGTEGSKDIYRAMANAGIGTIVGMHLSEGHRKNAKEAHINVVVASHIASDSLGMNLFLDELEQRGIKIIPCGGLIRISRFKK